MIWILIIFTLHVLGMLSAFKAVMETRTSQGAIAWVIFLVSFPYISLPVYWILGRNRFRGYTSAKHIKDEKIQADLAEFLGELKRYQVPSSEISAAEAAAEKLALLPMLQKNSVELLIDGDATFESILKGIAEAEAYILFQFFIVKDDEIGRKIKEALVAKAKEGVKVYFLYDEIGSHSLSKSYMSDLEAAGIMIHPFHTQKGIFNRFQINFRNHRKVVVVDGKHGWIGGHNVGDEYLGRSPKFGHWRDTHIKISGPAVLAVQVSFVEDWLWALDEGIGELLWEPYVSDEKDQKVLIVPSGPADERETAALMFHHAINSAQQRIWIASPYFVPDDAIISALQLAGLRGVDVRILIPDRPDHLLVYLAAYTYFENLIQTDVRFFRYTNGFLHEKVMLIDDETATVGTANFDNRSFRLNFEITAIVKDCGFASEVEKMFLDDFDHAREMTESDLRQMSLWFKFKARMARLTSPIQ
ncbi:cardiolipin synthase [Sulfurovum riftiae]|uniref:Cardiolipin synthase n=1 Tax=Sulfurovum riftiae TaxID=1630136 RepID=A0A151CJL1_9BACT|nr:cardiolipin synthase [Sulfurovum riftiae]KYJ87715.1 cardiolipin synthase [Sulfurovum riftiae]